MDEPITNKQLAFLKNRVIWLAVGHPTPEFTVWRYKQDTEDMESKAKRLSKYQASDIISEAMQGNWQKTIDLWEKHTSNLVFP